MEGRAIQQRLCNVRNNKMTIPRKGLFAHLFAKLMFTGSTKAAPTLLSNHRWWSKPNSEGPNLGGTYCRSTKQSLTFFLEVWGLGPQKKLDFANSEIVYILGYFTVLLQSSYACSFRKRLTMTSLLQYLDLLLQDIGQKVGGPSGSTAYVSNHPRGKCLHLDEFVDTSGKTVRDILLDKHPPCCSSTYRLFDF